MSKPDRLLTLDAMRGIAAICVMVTHIQVAGMPHLVASGYLAVDFFFLLSGLVIARTYGDRLNAGLTFARFAAVRAIRIYPLYLVGFALGFIKCLGQILFDRPDRLSVPDLMTSALFEVFLLPSPANTGLFALDGPAWSLFFELAINVVYALLLVKAGTRMLVAFAAGCGALLVFVALSNGSLNVGQSWSLFHGGVARVGFSFTAGVVLERVWTLGARDSRWALVPMLLLVAGLSVPVGGVDRSAYDLVAVMLAAPLLVCLGASFNPMPSLKRLCETLGELSYPVYVIHYPMLWIFGYLARKAGIAPVVWIPTFLALVIGAAWCLNRYWDKPVRARLGAALARLPRRAEESVPKPRTKC